MKNPESINILISKIARANDGNEFGIYFSDVFYAGKTFGAWYKNSEGKRVEFTAKSEQALLDQLQSIAYPKGL